MNPRTVIGLIVGGAVALFLGITIVVGTEKNDDSNWQVEQTTGGTIIMHDEPGWYWKGFGDVWTWPRAYQDTFSNVRATFNDGGTGTMNGTIRYRLPTGAEQRRELHREFGGNIANVHQAVISHLINCVKVTGPVMSGSEHQSARKGEFYNLVYEQLAEGLYQTVRVERTLQDQFDTQGNPITVFATEIITDDEGNPLIETASPLDQYGIEVAQFSIESTDYDGATLKQFSAKKDALLAAERSKAEREQEVQARLMIIEKGLREKAEVEAEANKEKARFTIEAERKVAVAEQEALQAIEIAEKAVTDAQRERDVAALNLEAERLNAEAITVLAAAEEERIQKAGAITENDRVLAEIDKEARIGVARELSNTRTPGFLIAGGNGEGGGGTFENLINVFLMRQMGVFDPSTAQMFKAAGTPNRRAND